MHGGGPVILGRLLQACRPGSYVVVTNRKAFFSGTVKTGHWLPAPYYFLDEPGAKTSSDLQDIHIPNQPHGTPPQRGPILHWLAEAAADAIALPDILRVRNMIRRVLAEHPTITTVYAASDNGTFLLGTYLAARSMRKRFVVHLFDLYRGNAFGPFRQLLARLYEKSILRRADTIIVTSQHTADYLNRRYRQAFATKLRPIYHPLPGRQRPRVIPKRPPGKPFEIIYTGTLGWPQKDCLADLVRATRGWADIRITILAPYSTEQMAAWGMTGPQVETGSATPEEVERRQQAADVLFLPMTFHPESRAIVETASPGKIAEYLESGKPILIYAPAFSHVARYGRETGFGLVVDEEGDAPLQTAIRRLQKDQDLRGRLAAQARAVFEQNHEEAGVLTRFRAAIEGTA